MMADPKIVEAERLSWRQKELLEMRDALVTHLADNENELQKVRQELEELDQ